VLGLTIAAMLYSRFPDAPEGHLSRALADLVRKETCAAVAGDLGLGAALRVGKGERKNGLARKPAVLGDACEAVLGAIYLDAGFAGCRG
jgi:ribonuclease-3